MITKEKVLRDYNTIKKVAIKDFEQGNFESCLKCIEAAAYLAHNFNYFYFDDDFEKIIKVIGKPYSLKLSNKKNNNKVVFYDSFGLDNRGLTEQYLNAFYSWGAEVLYILESDQNIKSATRILKNLKIYEKSNFLIINNGKFKINKIKEISQAIANFSPDLIFTHKNPWNTIGNAVFSNVYGVDIFHINLTDHAYWLGKNAATYFLEFRNYGASISYHERKIEKYKLLMQPYYPIISDNTFQGFDRLINNKIKLFTGGSFYKMYGENEKFFQLLKKTLNDNPETVLLVAGSGFRRPFENFIFENNFERRIYFLGDRSDIDKVFENIDIYIGTYPVLGGLMSQYAAVKKKPIVAYSSDDLPFNNVDEIIINSEFTSTYTSEEEFHFVLNKLIQNSTYRTLISNSMEASVLSPKEFNKKLRLLTEKKINEKCIDFYKVDIEKFADTYLERENLYFHNYDEMIFGVFRAKKWSVPMKYILNIFRYGVKAFFIKLNKVIKNKI